MSGAVVSHCIYHGDCSVDSLDVLEPPHDTTGKQCILILRPLGLCPQKTQKLLVAWSKLADCCWNSEILRINGTQYYRAIPN